MPNLLLRRDAQREILDIDAGFGAPKPTRGLLMDLNANAFRIVRQLTTETKEDKRSVAGRAGGKLGGPARASKLTAAERRAIAVKANQARWKRP